METIEPGIYGNIDNADYHAGPGLSSTDLKRLAQSPLHYLTSKTKPTESTEYMSFGNAVHCAVLEPERFEELYVRAPEGDKRSKAVKEAWTELENAGKIPLSHNDFEAIQGITLAIQEHPLAGRWLSGGTAELSGYWLQHVNYSDLETDILCKCRPDYVKETGSQYAIIDLKTTRSAEAGFFSRMAYWEYSYHISAAHYLTGMEALRGLRAQGFVFIAVEKTPPYAVNVFEASAEFIRAGERANKRLYQLFASCQASGKWPGYPAVRQELRLPRGAKIGEE